MTVEDIPAVDKALKREFLAHQAPIIELIEAQTHDPFCVLVGTILSSRTKDACTAGAVRRLMAACPDGNGFKATFENFKIKHLPDQRRLEWLEKNKE